MHGVDPAPLLQIQVVGAREEADQGGATAGPPYSEGEGQGARFDLDVVVADGDGAGADVGAGEEAGVEGGGRLAMDRDGGEAAGAAMGGEGRERSGRGGRVAPEDEHGGYQGMRGVGGGKGAEKGEAGLGVPVDEDGEPIRPEGERIRQGTRVAGIGVRLGGE